MEPHRRHDVIKDKSEPSPPGPLSRRERGRKTAAKNETEGIQYTFAILNDLGVLEPHHLQSPCAQAGIASRLARRRWEVRSAIRFDHEASLVAVEIDEEWPDWVLTPKLRPFHLSISHRSP